MSNNNLLCKIKPKYNIAYSILSHLGDVAVCVFILVILAFQPNMIKNIVITAIAIIMIALIILLFKSKCSKSFFYEFYPDRLKYKDTYFSKKVKELKYSEITEIRYNQTFLQSKFNLGEIDFLTSSKNIFKKVVSLTSVSNVKEKYERIVELFNA